MKKLIPFAVIAALLFGGCSEIKPVVTEVPPPPPKKQVLVPETNLPADKLQELFLQITSKTTPEELETYAANTNLFFSKNNNFTYKIAFRESDTYFGRGTTYGDLLTVRFNEDWTFGVATYYYSKTEYHARIMFRDDVTSYYAYTEDHTETRTPTAKKALQLAVSK